LGLSRKTALKPKETAMYSTRHLAALGEQIAETGTGAHTKTLHHMAASVRGVAPGVAAVLIDSSAPEIVRQRAFAVAAGIVSRHE